MGSDIIVLEKEMIRSEVFRSLKGISIIVYLDFRMKCQIKSINRKAGRKAERVILNNGDIEYCYSEALKKGITRARFKRALEELVEKGFIDIIHSGSGGVKGDKSKYAISDRWQKWGADGFVNKVMEKDNRKGRGFEVYWEKKRNNLR